MLEIGKHAWENIHYDIALLDKNENLSFGLEPPMHRLGVDKLSKSTYLSLAPITVFVISGLQSVIY